MVNTKDVASVRLAGIGAELDDTAVVVCESVAVVVVTEAVAFPSVDLDVEGPVLLLVVLVVTAAVVDEVLVVFMVDSGLVVTTLLDVVTVTMPLDVVEVVVVDGALLAVVGAPVVEVCALDVGEVEVVVFDSCVVEVCVVGVCGEDCGVAELLALVLFSLVDVSAGDVVTSSLVLAVDAVVDELGATSVVVLLPVTAVLVVVASGDVVTVELEVVVSGRMVVVFEEVDPVVLASAVDTGPDVVDTVDVLDVTTSADVVMVPVLVEVAVVVDGDRVVGDNVVTDAVVDGDEFAVGVLTTGVVADVGIAVDVSVDVAAVRVVVPGVTLVVLELGPAPVVETLAAHTRSDVADGGTSSC